jgi:shikimate kinase
VNLYLVGYRCVGKTGVGRLVSATLKWTFVDMDQVLEVEEGTTIQEMVASRGWPYFRERETRLLKRLSRKSSQVIATGGGVVTGPGNVSLMRQSGKVVWLQATAATIACRMLSDTRTIAQRPALRGESAMDEIAEILQERLPLYEKAVHFCVDTDQRSTEEVAGEVLRWLEQAGGIVGTRQ